MALNGPYSVGAVLLRALQSKCVETKSCSELSKKFLEISYLDQADRVITSSVNSYKVSADAGPGMKWNDAPEGKR